MESSAAAASLEGEDEDGDGAFRLAQSAPAVSTRARRSCRARRALSRRASLAPEPSTNPPPPEAPAVNARSAPHSLNAFRSAGDGGEERMAPARRSSSPSLGPAPTSSWSSWSSWLGCSLFPLLSPASAQVPLSTSLFSQLGPPPCAASTADPSSARRPLRLPLPLPLSSLSESRRAGRSPRNASTASERPADSKSRPLGVRWVPARALRKATKAGSSFWYRSSNSFLPP
mmetsp:Transcript_31876/g.63523  ORF Transcript_31876/g.63523 Transcript_31876/m.63523 type:complete len:230 (-) Transcript_31876:1057-1746(-)